MFLLEINFYMLFSSLGKLNHLFFLQTNITNILYRIRIKHAKQFYLKISQNRRSLVMGESVSLLVWSSFSHTFVLETAPETLTDNCKTFIESYWNNNIIHYCITYFLKIVIPFFVSFFSFLPILICGQITNLDKLSVIQDQ